MDPAFARALGRQRVRVTYDVDEQPERWLLDEEDLPESTLHDQIIDLLKVILLAWVARQPQSALVARNFACRWDPADARVGVDPDIALIAPAPPSADDLGQLRVWEPGHHPPRVAVEVVSPSTADKDYHDAPARYARLGARELWVFDPKREGSADTGGPFVLQIWRFEEGQMRRTYAGAGPARSDELAAWLVVTDGGTRLRIAEDREGTRVWPTAAEELARRADEQASRADEQASRADAAEREIESLRRMIAERRGD
jgi:Uma2 family endonuclease